MTMTNEISSTERLAGIKHRVRHALTIFSFSTPGGVGGDGYDGRSYRGVWFVDRPL